MMKEYSTVIQWSEEDSGYIATIPELSGLSAFGVTREEALQELEVAKEAYLEVFKEDGCELPDPDTLNSFSGQTRTRLPKSLHASLSREAKIEGVSLNSYIVYLLSERNIGRRVERKIDELQAGSQNFIIQYQTGYDDSIREFNIDDNPTWGDFYINLSDEKNTEEIKKLH
jgi:predicted RNase H-like HicB family nuclease